MASINFKHLRYFWVVAKSGGIARAGELLNLTPQSISGQLGVLEEQLGVTLFRRAGRGLELTDAGRMVLGYADQIFTLGEELKEALEAEPAGRSLAFRVGIADMVPKSLAYQLLEPAMRIPEKIHIVCREGRLADLLADLAVHRVDLVIADRPMPTTLNVRGFNHLLGECGVTFFAAPELAASLPGEFPQCLHGAPMLLPGEDAAVRPLLMQWLEARGVRPRIVGEFDDGALLKAFGRAGVGVFPVPTALAPFVVRQYEVEALGEADMVTERFYAISVERRLSHPAVVAVRDAARDQMFAARNATGE